MPNENTTQTVEYTDLEVLNYHNKNFPTPGKIEVISKTSVRTAKDLTLAYSPGVAVACTEIEKNPETLGLYTNIKNTVAVISNGTRILGLGDIGIAGYPVMEGKSILFKALANVDAFPLILHEKDPDKFVSHVQALAQNFGGINLEDIQHPDCFYIERKLNELLDIPVFHDDQWGTAIVTLAGLFNALKIVNKKIENVKVVVNGTGAAGIAIAKMLLTAGVRGENMMSFDRSGALFSGRVKGMNPYKDELANLVNPKKLSPSLAEACEGADVLIGVSAAGQFKSSYVKSMNDDAIVFGLANPVPEILPNEAYKAGARIVATGRSDFANQINNVLGFPAIFRGTLDVGATDITDNMKIAAANAIAELTAKDPIHEERIIISPTDPRIMPYEASAVARAAIKDGVNTNSVTAEEVLVSTENRLKFYRKHISPLVEKRQEFLKSI